MTCVVRWEAAGQCPELMFLINIFKCCNTCSISMFHTGVHLIEHMVAHMFMSMLVAIVCADVNAIAYIDDGNPHEG